MESIALYEGALEGYERELKVLEKFGDGRIGQWKMLLRDYKKSRQQFADANEILRWYAGGKNYCLHTYDLKSWRPILEDGGKRADDFLKQYKEKK